MGQVQHGRPTSTSTSTIIPYNQVQAQARELEFQKFWILKKY